MHSLFRTMMRLLLIIVVLTRSSQGRRISLSSGTNATAKSVTSHASMPVSEDGKSNISNVSTSVKEDDKSTISDVSTSVEEEDKNNISDVSTSIKEDDKSTISDVSKSVNGDKKSTISDVISKEDDQSWASADVIPSIKETDKSITSVNVDAKNVALNHLPVSGDDEYVTLMEKVDDVIRDDDLLSIENVVHPFWDHLDFFQCPPCKCFRSLSHHSYANCTYRGLNEIPSTLPRNLIYVNMAGNRMREFNVSHTITYRELRILNLSHNKIKRIFSEESVMFVSKINFLHLENNKIKTIDKNSFKSLAKLLKLYLHNNRIYKINSTTFRNLPQLRHLDLSANGIQTIDPSSFDSLVQMRTLHINDNHMSYEKLCQPRLAKNLKNLEVLYMQDNVLKKEPQYPNEFLSKLTNLKELHIDLLENNAQFGPQMIDLKHLKSITFGPNAFTDERNISATFFENVPLLESLSFEFVEFNYIDPRAFHRIPNLLKYSLSYISTYDLESAFQGLVGFHNSSLKSLSFVGLESSAPICRTLTREHGQYLTGLRLKELVLSHNRLADLDDNFINCLPTTLIRLVLDGNKFQVSNNLWSSIPFLINLLELDMQRQNEDWYICIVPSYGRSSFSISSCLKSHQQRNVNRLTDNHTSEICSSTDRVEDFVNLLSNRQENRWTETADSVSGGSHINSASNLDKKQHVGSKSHKESVRFDDVDSGSKFGKVFPPPNLIRVLASGYMSLGTVLFFDGAYEPFKLWNLDFSRNLMTDWGLGKLPASTVTLNLNDNPCDSLSPEFFPPDSNLTNLNIRKNYLGTAFSEDKDGALLRNLGKLVHLDMSLNSIASLPVHFFKGLRRLKTLRLDDNKLQVLNVNLSYTPELEYIDVSHNSISWIEESVREDLDNLGSHHSVKLDLTYNALPCTCSGIEVLEWMTNTKVKLLSKDYLQCTDEKGNSRYIQDIKATVKKLRGRCVSYLAYIVGCVAGAGGIFLTIAMAIILYKKRWHIMYFMNNGLFKKYYGYKPRGGGQSSSKFKYDAYVVYEQDDRDFVLWELRQQLEDKRKHRVCVEDIDFIPGTWMLSNIVNAVMNSRVTLLVVSPDFVLTNDFDHIIQMALIEEYNCPDKRQVCKVLLYRPTPSKDMCRELQMLMKKDRFLEYPQDNSARTTAIVDDFWDRLSSELGRNPTISCPCYEGDQENQNHSGSGDDTDDPLVDQNGGFENEFEGPNSNRVDESHRYEDETQHLLE